MNCAADIVALESIIRLTSANAGMKRAAKTWWCRSTLSILVTSMLKT